MGPVLINGEPFDPAEASISVFDIGSTTVSSARTRRPSRYRKRPGDIIGAILRSIGSGVGFPAGSAYRPASNSGNVTESGWLLPGDRATHSLASAL